jgi:serine/threonine protein kinase
MGNYKGENSCMPRVVCPLCRTGFETHITRDNFAVNCVACGVAFNASHYLTRDDLSQAKAPARIPEPEPVLAAGVAADPSSNGTRANGMLFNSEHDEPTPKSVAKKHETSLPVVASRHIEAKAAAPEIILERSADECPIPLKSNAAPQFIVVPTPPPSVVLDAELAKAELKNDKPIAAPVAAVIPAPVPAEKQRVEAKPKKGRRPLLEGSFGPYDIEGEIARGGVGAVFRARERDGGRQVALKVLLDGDEAGESERERFRHECETAKALSLPGMVQVYDVGELEQKPYMAMELVNGRSLDKVIPEKSLSVNDCLVLMKSVADTIGALHESGYVHRDLKPGNILIDAFGSPKVADFGLVKSLDEITRLTASGLVCGTPAYMAPEQARGDGKAVDPRSDVWALGAVLYEMLTAQAPFQAENALRLMLKITKDTPKPPRMLNLKVPQDVHYIVMKCLEKNPEKRYPNARAMAEDIGRFLNGEPLEVRSQPRMQQIMTVALLHQRRIVMAASAVTAVLFLALVLKYALSPSDPGPIVERGYEALAKQLIPDAEKAFREAIAADPQYARAYLGLGLCLGRRGIQQEKIADPKLVDEARTMTGKAAQLDKSLLPDAHAQIATFNRWLKAYEYEIAELEKAVAAAPNNAKLHAALGMAYWNFGSETKSQEQFNKASREFHEVLKLDATYPKVATYIKMLQENYLAKKPNTVARKGR